MIDPVELKALVEKARAWAVNRRMVRPIGGSDALPVFLDQVADALLALSDEVERLKRGEQIAQDSAVAQFNRAEAAESEAQALRERMGEIRAELSELNIPNEELTRLRNDMEGKEWTRVWARACQKIIDCVRNCRRIAALSTTPKEKEG